MNDRVTDGGLDACPHDGRSSGCGGGDASHSRRDWSASFVKSIAKSMPANMATEIRPKTRAYNNIVARAGTSILFMGSSE